MKQLDYEQTRAMLLYVSEQIVAAKALLTEIDGRIGDGDHGIGMERGMKKAGEKLASMEGGSDVYALFQEMGKTMLMSMGGASGVIFGTLFMGGAKGRQPSPALDCAALSALLEESLRQIQARGKAQVGDKTMVDALEPAVRRMRAYGGDDLAELLAQAEAEARKGVEDTKAYRAKYGRAKSLMERAVGHQDAGATSTWIIFRAMSEFVSGLQEGK